MNIGRQSILFIVLYLKSQMIATFAIGKSAGLSIVAEDLPGNSPS